MIHILKLAGNGVPQAWLSVEDAALHYAAGEVTWEAGQPIATLHGGTNAASGRRSELTVNSIFGVSGFGKVNPFDIGPLLTNDQLFRRDRNTCGYCGVLGAWGSFSGATGRCLTRSTRRQRTQCWGAISRSGGSSVLHAGSATGQRPAKRQPGGGLIGLGGSPLSLMRWAARLRPPCTGGTADISATL